MKKIGINLSFCVKEILEGIVKEEDVDLIFAAEIRSEVQLKNFIEVCKEFYWKINPAEGENIAKRLLAAKKIIFVNEKIISETKRNWVDSFSWQ